MGEKSQLNWRVIWCSLKCANRNKICCKRDCFKTQQGKMSCYAPKKKERA